MKKNIKIFTLLLVAVLTFTACKAKPKLSDTDILVNSEATKYAETYHKGSTVSDAFEDKEVNGEMVRMWEAQDANGMSYQIILSMDVVNGPEDEIGFESAIQMTDNHDWLLAKEVLKDFPELGELTESGAFATTLTTKSTCTEDEVESRYSSYLNARDALAAAGVIKGYWVDMKTESREITFSPFD